MMHTDTSASLYRIEQRLSAIERMLEQATRGRRAAVEKHYATKDAAALIGCTSGALRNMRLTNKGPRWVVTSDKTIRYPESAIKEYLSGKT